jgi:hypothetical protein
MMEQNNWQTTYNNYRVNASCAFPADCNSNAIPDECDLDCDAPGCSPPCGTSEDCNLNGTPDECDIAAGTSEDGDANGVPDECESDFDGDGIVDGVDPDIDNDGVLNETDVCDYGPLGAPVDCQGRPRGDMDEDCDIDLADYAAFAIYFMGPSVEER